MADDSDVPPLEDMTGVLKQADAIRDKREINSDVGVKSQKEKAKSRAKVNKKVNAHAVKPESFAGGDTKIENVLEPQPLITEPAPVQLETKADVKKSTNDGGFGGMKKGFLFGSPSPKPKTTPTTITKTEDSKPAAPTSSKPKQVKDEIPFIKANGKTESGLTFDEVQTAMSEAKGLMENQDWISDDLLTKVEKNEVLCKRFADPTFMKALEEFQTNPTGAMEKYKGNTEVEKFLQEFCGLLGDHFTNFVESPDSKKQSANPASSSSKSSKPTANSPLPSQTKPQNLTKKTQGPKIVEITDDNEVQNKPAVKQQSKIVEITDSKTKEPSAIKLPGNSTAPKQRSPDIVTRSPTQGADMQAMPTKTDEEVKQMLSDPKVMEVLMDPKVMQLIELLRNDPYKAQKTVDSADPDLKSKVRFLVSKGLLQFQTG